MRRRLLFSTLAVAVTAVLLFGLPLAFVLTQLQASITQDQVQRDATLVARTLQNRLNSSVAINLADYGDAARSLPDRYVSIIELGQPGPMNGFPYHNGSQPAKGSAITARAATRNFRVVVEA